MSCPFDPYKLTECIVVVPHSVSNRLSPVRRPGTPTVREALTAQVVVQEDAFQRGQGFNQVRGRAHELVQEGLEHWAGIQGEERRTKLDEDRLRVCVQILKEIEER